MWRLCASRDIWEQPTLCGAIPAYLRQHYPGALSTACCSRRPRHGRRPRHSPVQHHAVALRRGRRGNLRRAHPIRVRRARPSTGGGAQPRSPPHLHCADTHTAYPSPHRSSLVAAAANPCVSFGAPPARRGPIGANPRGRFPPHGSPADRPAVCRECRSCRPSGAADRSSPGLPRGASRSSPALPTADCRLPTADCRLPTAEHVTSVSAVRHLRVCRVPKWGRIGNSSPSGSDTRQLFHGIHGKAVACRRSCAASQQNVWET
jgi:hypothetical protein